MQEMSNELYEASRHAYNSWTEARKATLDLSGAAWEGVLEAYETSWTKYREAKDKLFNGAESALETASKDYRLARDATAAAAKKVTDFLAKYKDKVEERLSETFFSGLETVEDGASQARKNLIAARDKVSSLYEKSYEEAVDDLNAAAQYFSDATDRLKTLAEAKTKDAKAKKRLEEGRDKARLAYRAAKKRAQDSKAKLDEFYSDLSKYLEEYHDAVKRRAEEDMTFFNRFKEDAKWRADKNYNSWLSSLQKVSDRVALELREAEEGVASVKDKVAKWGADAMEIIRQKYQNLKDEL
jgi:uncharacterized phage infection (PIP) family protein YhgE